jgi:hypothetical protein
MAAIIESIIQGLLTGLGSTVGTVIAYKYIIPQMEKSEKIKETLIALGEKINEKKD